MWDVKTTEDDQHPGSYPAVTTNTETNQFGDNVLKKLEITRTGMYVPGSRTRL